MFKSRLFPSIILCLAALLAFWPSLFNGFVNWDDKAYVLNNPLIKELSFGSIQDIFTSFVVGNYQPLTILTFAVEHRFFGLEPFFYHLNNLILHMINGILVFIFADQLLKDKKAAFFAALLFVIHPLRVESVAWVTERKDVLFAAFYLSGLIVYGHYLETKLKRNSLLMLTILLFFISCLSKPAAVTFPLILLLIDYLYNRPIGFKLIFEKIGLFVVSLLFGLLALKGLLSPVENVYLWGQDVAAWSNQTIVPREILTSNKLPMNMFERLLLSAHAVVIYLLQFIFCTNLSAYYPYPVKIESTLPAFLYFNGAVFSLLITFIVLSFKFNRKMIVFGFMFFLFTISLNLPFTSVGHTPHADRFTYLPSVGLMILLAHYGRLWHKNLPLSKVQKVYIGSTVGCVLIFLVFTTFVRCKVWKNSETLWTDVIVKTGGIDFAYYNRGHYYLEENMLGEAINDFSQAIRRNPNNTAAFVNRGIAFSLVSDFSNAILDHTKTIQLKPNYPLGYINRGGVYAAMGNAELASKVANKALSIDPNNPLALEILEKVDAIK